MYKTSLSRFWFVVAYMLVLGLLAYSNIRGLGFVVLLSMTGFPIFLPPQKHPQIDSTSDCRYEDLTRMSSGKGVFLAGAFVAPGLIILFCNLFGVFHTALSSGLELSVVFGVISLMFGTLAVAIHRRKKMLKSSGGNYRIAASDFLFLLGCVFFGGTLVFTQSELNLQFSWGAGSMGFVFGLIGLILERGIRSHESAVVLAAPAEKAHDNALSNAISVEKEQGNEVCHFSAFRKVRKLISLAFAVSVVYVLVRMDHPPSSHDFFWLAICFSLFLSFDIFASIVTGEHELKFGVVLRKKEPATYFFWLALKSCLLVALSFWTIDRWPM